MAFHCFMMSIQSVNIGGTGGLLFASRGVTYPPYHLRRSAGGGYLQLGILKKQNFLWTSDLSSLMDFESSSN